MLSDRGSTYKFKRRHLKDLASEELEEIVRVYEEEHLLQRELAERFKVSEQLIGRIIRNPADRAKQIKKARDSKERSEQIKEAMEEAA